MMTIDDNNNNNIVNSKVSCTQYVFAIALGIRTPK